MYSRSIKRTRDDESMDWKDVQEHPAVKHMPVNAFLALSLSAPKNIHIHVSQCSLKRNTFAQVDEIDGSLSTIQAVYSLLVMAASNVQMSMKPQTLRGRLAFHVISHLPVTLFRDLRNKFHHPAADWITCMHASAASLFIHASQGFHVQDMDTWVSRDGKSQDD